MCQLPLSYTPIVALSLLVLHLLTVVSLARLVSMKRIEIEVSQCFRIKYNKNGFMLCRQKTLSFKFFQFSSLVAYPLTIISRTRRGLQSVERNSRRKMREKNEKFLFLILESVMPHTLLSLPRIFTPCHPLGLNKEIHSNHSVRLRSDSVGVQSKLMKKIARSCISEIISGQT